MMTVNVLLFGRLAEIAGSSRVLIDNVPDIAALNQALHKSYPLLSDMKYLIAVDKQVVSGNQELRNDMTVALLPPFSGG